MQNYYEERPSGTVSHRAGRDAERVAALVAELAAEPVAERVWRESEERNF